MQVVVFCGGQGLRLANHPSGVPKPMVPVGPYPMLVHVLRGYARQGHDDFVLAAGQRREIIAEYFAEHPDLPDVGRCRIRVVDTGSDATIGGRLAAVASLLDGPLVLAGYGDVLSDERLGERIAVVEREPRWAASLVSVRPTASFHLVEAAADGRVRALCSPEEAGLRINGGYFVLRREVLDELRNGEDLVGGLFERLAAAGRLHAHRHDGFWAPMDTMKDHQVLEDLWRSGEAPWWT